MVGGGLRWSAKTESKAFNCILQQKTSEISINLSYRVWKFNKRFDDNATKTMIMVMKRGNSVPETN